MSEAEIMIVGAGPAGLVAATTLAQTGFSVEVVEQRQTPGGAIYRQPAGGHGKPHVTPSSNARWQRLWADFTESTIPVRYGQLFLGIDAEGFVLVEDRDSCRVRRLRRKGVLIAVGAVERVSPRPGWHLAGVSTAGGLQVMMKETGRAPEGRILLAGNGPLLIAVAAQMARLGNPPVAIIEAGDPVRRIGAGLGLLSHSSVMIEAFSYLSKVYRSRIPWLRGADLLSIGTHADGLDVRVRHKGAELQFIVDRIGLHDGIRQNDFGLPAEDTKANQAPFVLHAGDCREPLGAMAAEADGHRAARRLAGLLTGNPENRDLDATLDRWRTAQALLARLFAPFRPASPLDLCTDDTVLCRCEARTVGDLRELLKQAPSISGREVKLNGRFAMGACQGRFCADNTAHLLAALGAGNGAEQQGPRDITGRRWPLRPVSIGALIAASESHSSDSQDEVHRDDAS